MKTTIYKKITYILLLFFIVAAVIGCSKERLDPKQENTAGADSTSNS